MFALLAISSVLHAQEAGITEAELNETVADTALTSSIDVRKYSERLFQPAANQTTFAISPSIQSSSSKWYSSTQSGRGSVIGFELAHGITENIALSVGSDWGQSEMSGGDSSTTKVRGMGDLTAQINSAWSMGRPSSLLSLGVAYSYSPGPQKMSYANDSIERNRMTGGDTIAPQVGAQFDLGAGYRAGFAATYFLIGRQKYEIDGRSGESEEDISSWTPVLFAEKDFTEFTGGAEVVYERWAHRGNLSAAVYGVVESFKGIQLVPRLGYETSAVGAESGYRYDALSASFTARLLL